MRTEIENLELLTDEELQNITGGHISADTDFGHDVGFIAGAFIKYGMYGGLIRLYIN